MPAQGYKEITLTTALKDSLPLLLHNDEASITCSAGIAFPTDNLKEGMLCYRSDLDGLYQYRKGVWIDILKQLNDDLTALGEAIIEAFEEIDGVVLSTKANESDFQALKTQFETLKGQFETFKTNVETNYAKKSEVATTYLEKTDFQSQIDDAYASLETALNGATETETA